MSVNWIKQGLIYCPDGEGFYKTHATRPIPLKIDEQTLRIFFSSRDYDDRMLPNFIEVDIDNPKESRFINRDKVIDLGAPGEFDDSGAALCSAVKKNDNYYFFYTGWKRRRVVSFELAIGAYEYNKKSNQLERVFRGPILHQDIKHPLFVATPFVVHHEGIYKMWYCNGTDWKFPNDNPEPIYTVFYAESEDGIVWNNHKGPIIPFKFDGEVVSAPWVVKTKQGYSMWYSYRGCSGKQQKNYLIGYAESKDGINWTRQDEKSGITVSDNGWDSEMACYPAVYNHKGKTYMLYSGNHVGRGGIGYAVADRTIDIVDW